MDASAAWAALLQLSAPVFTGRSFAILVDVARGWVLVPGRRTITAIISVTDPEGRRAHDAYHRFVRDGRWAMASLWRVVAIHAIARFAPAGVVAIDCDDTLCHKSGRHIDGAGVFRDALRSEPRSGVQGPTLLVRMMSRTRPVDNSAKRARPAALADTIACTHGERDTSGVFGR